MSDGLRPAEGDRDTLAPPRQPLQGSLTSQQRVILRLMEGSIRQLDRGTRDEQWTAALLRLCADAVEQGYTAELVEMARAWARQREGGA